MATTQKRIELAAPLLDERDARAVADAVAAGWVSGIGPYVEQFERRFAEFCGVTDGVATSSGTTALHLALVTLGIGPGDEVILPSLTFVATANAVRYAGASVIFADVDPATWVLSPESVAARTSERTAAVIAVHLAGQPVDMRRIREAAGPRARLIEDAAQAIGSTAGGRSVGTLGDAGCFSFFPNKVITTGEGGMLLLENAALLDHARHLRSHAKVTGSDYVHDAIGFNFRMTSLQAALGSSQLQRVKQLISARLRVADEYDRLLTGSPYMPQARTEDTHRVPSFYAVLADDQQRRDRALAALSSAGIEARPMFTPLHRQSPHRSSDRLIVSDEIGARGLLLPCGARITRTDVEQVVRTLP